MKAQKKSVIIDFFDFSKSEGLQDFDNWIISFNDVPQEVYYTHAGSHPYAFGVSIKTLEGTSYDVDFENDVIIRKVIGEYYPYKKDVFEKIYDVLN